MSVSVKKATSTNITFLWYLRNQPDVYQYFKTPKPVAWEEHVNWIVPILLSLSEKTIYLISYNDLPAGQLRFNFEPLAKNKLVYYENHSAKIGSAEISISLLKEFRGKGIAKIALKKGIEMMKRGKKMKTLTAEIHQDNATSLTLFEEMGFTQIDARGPYIHYQLSL